MTSATARPATTATTATPFATASPAARVTTTARNARWRRCSSRAKSKGPLVDDLGDRQHGLLRPASESSPSCCRFRQRRRSKERRQPNGGGMATAGLVLGIVGLVLSVAWIPFYMSLN